MNKKTKSLLYYILLCLTFQTKILCQTESGRVFHNVMLTLTFYQRYTVEPTPPMVSKTDKNTHVHKTRFKAGIINACDVIIRPFDLENGLSKLLK